MTVPVDRAVYNEHWLFAVITAADPLEAGRRAKFVDIEARQAAANSLARRLYALFGLVRRFNDSFRDSQQNFVANTPAKVDKNKPLLQNR